MIYMTQLVYLHPGKEKIFDDFEAIAMPIIARYNGKLLLRIRPQQSAVISSSIEVPYEIHLVQFDAESDFEHFKKDEERKKFLHLKEESVRTVLLIKGERI
jgi:hypothetical protein